MAWGAKAPQQQDEELLWNVVSEVVNEVAHLETELTPDKLSKRIRDYFRKAAKGLEFGQKPWQQLINDYADNVFGNMFNGLGDRPWLEQADFLLCLDAAVKDNFPPYILERVPQQAFECTVLAAHDRAYEEQRFLPILWETVRENVDGQKTKKLLYNAGEHGRKIAATPNPNAQNEVEDFVGRWIDATIEHVARTNGGDPAWTLPVEQAVDLFNALMARGSLPLAMREAHGPPPVNWPFIEASVRTAYAMHSSQSAQAWSGGGKKNKNRRGGGNWQAAWSAPEAEEQEGDAPVAFDPEEQPVADDEADGELEGGAPAAKKFKGGW
eukprot:TRINITY_DN2380_c1_g1_i1.p1 TRINITY_DN2380_c1_g1~~TRINITY_DN2380_c1_g1_i1.p1  ORF type:complete len:325 (-),score=83.42 TRINITY_DN2380_c1_g1_i1:84-1058(-)